jgi:outer membrane protein, heavy metal efflux system
MTRSIIIILLLIFAIRTQGQRLVTQEEAVNAALANQRNLKSANLSIQQQEQLLRSSSALENPQVFAEASPYEPVVLGVQQSFDLPVVYRNRKQLQRERIRLAQLQLSGSQLELKRNVRLSYLQLQYFTERNRVLQYQDSVYEAIRVAAVRFFAAGQINKLEELQALTQAAQVRNVLERNELDLASEMQLFRFYLGQPDSFSVEPIANYDFIPLSDTNLSNIKLKILDQQVRIEERELKLSRSEILPGFQAGVLFPTTSDYERPVGYQVGITIPIWGALNRSRINAAKTSIEIAKANRDLEQQRLNALYRQATYDAHRELQSLTYYNTIALPQARQIIETSQRLFNGGELNYIESLRNLQSAFSIFLGHLDTHKAYNEAVIQLNYLKGIL